MKTKLFTFLVALFMMFTITSCDVYTYTTTQDDIYTETNVDIVRSNVSFDIIIKYGSPFYRDGTLLYYLYNDIYYYPYFYNNYWYVRAYRRPFVHLGHRPYFRPHHYDYKFSPGYYRGFGIPKHHINNYKRNFNPYLDNKSRRQNDRRLDVQPRRPNDRRPDVQSKKPNPDRKITTPNRNINNRGGRR